MLRKVWLTAGWLWVAIVFYLSLMPHPPEPVSFEGVDKLEHLVAYAWLMLWFCQVYLDQKMRMRLFVALAAMGVGIEILQSMGGYRYFEYADMLANTLGVAIGWGSAQAGLGNILRALEGMTGSREIRGEQ
ncbi:MAG: VanZ family protein [Gammaproteobacteria bacterium]|nr:VanZ family protein [Gammaproteobacteria bacterium]MBU1775319.1 VanZ family protein [Gammaproteobacteria bacterium]MBU1969642.1 VanZ family protein [Gammaproteobacteria bacterium]